MDTYRSALEQFAAVTAASITAPTLAATMNIDAGTPGGADVAYSGLTLHGIKDGKIAAMNVDKAAFTFSMQPAGKAEKLTGTLTSIASHDFDALAVAAMLDPEKANDDQYHRLYRQISTGAYTITGEQSLRMRVDGITVDDVAMQPSRLQLPALLAMIPPAGVVPSPSQARDFLEKAAKLYEGMRVGNAEMRGFSMDTPQGSFKIAAIRLNLENGKVGEFAIEGLDTRSPKGPVKVGRFALKSLDIANLLRLSALFSNPAQAFA